MIYCLWLMLFLQCGAGKRKEKKCCHLLLDVYWLQRKSKAKSVFIVTVNHTLLTAFFQAPSYEITQILQNQEAKSSLEASWQELGRNQHPWHSSLLTPCGMLKWVSGSDKSEFSAFSDKSVRQYALVPYGAWMHDSWSKTGALRETRQLDPCVILAEWGRLLWPWEEMWRLAWWRHLNTWKSNQRRRSRRWTDASCNQVTDSRKLKTIMELLKVILVLCWQN